MEHKYCKITKIITLTYLLRNTEQKKTKQDTG